MQYNDLLVFEPGNQYPNAREVAPFATLPAWWRGFIFKVLSPREFTVYMYIAMRADAQNAIAYPTAREIRVAMNLESDSAVFAALRTLEELGFIRRRAQKLPNRTIRLRRNVYQRAAPEFTLLTLLNRTGDGGSHGDKGVNELLEFATNPAIVEDPSAVSPVNRDLSGGVKHLLGDEDFNEYALTPDGEKREVLARILDEHLARRRQEGGQRYRDRQAAPRDRQRQQARERERSIAAAGGVQPADAFGDDLDDDIPF